jgi:methylmalonyl-CoA mutase C-terminal domain/subunit
LLKRIRERELDDVLVLFGGTIPKDDVALLKEIGVQGVFPSHAKLEEISTFIKENVHRSGE